MDNLSRATRAPSDGLGLTLPGVMAASTPATWNASEAGERDARDEELAVLEVSVQAAILALAVAGNGLVLLSLALRRRRRLSRLHVLMAHLSLADLFVAFFNVLPQLAWDITFRFHGGDVLCRAVKYSQLVGMYASSYVLLATAADRYLAIVHPLAAQRMTNKRVHLLAALAWLLALVFATPQLAIFALREVAAGSGVWDCWGVFLPAWTLQLYVVWSTLSVYVLPTLTLLAAYSAICLAVWRSARLQGRQFPGERRGQPGGSQAESQPRGISRAKLRTVKLTLTVIACYLACWSPFYVAQMWAAFDENAPFSGPSYTIILLLASLNSCTNPWIYLAFSHSLCLQARRLLGGTHATRGQPAADRGQRSRCCC